MSAQTAYEARTWNAYDAAGEIEENKEAIRQQALRDLLTEGAATIRDHKGEEVDLDAAEIIGESMDEEKYQVAMWKFSAAVKQGRVMKQVVAINALEDCIDEMLMNRINSHLD